MRFKKLFAVTSLAFTLTFSTAASAEPAALTVVREGVHGLETRMKVVRALSEKSPSARIRRDIDRILRAIDAKRASLAMRVAVVDLLGSEYVEARVLNDLANYFEATSKLLAQVESWFYLR